MKIKNLAFPISPDALAKMDKNYLTMHINGQRNFLWHFMRPGPFIAMFFTLVIAMALTLAWHDSFFQTALFNYGPLVKVSLFQRVSHIIIALFLPVFLPSCIIYTLYLRAKVKKAACYADNMQLLQNRLDEIIAVENAQNQKQATCYTNAVQEINAILQNCDCNNVASLKWNLSNYLRT